MIHENPENFDRDGALDDRLIELQLGGLPDASRAEIEARIARDPGLAAQQATLEEAFAALAGYKISIPSDLSDRVISRVHALPAGRSSKPRVAWPEEPNRMIRFHSLREITAVAAMIVLAVGVGVPGLVQMRDRSQRTACSWNLGQIGRGMQTYAQSFGDSMPFVGFGRQNSWQPTHDPSIVRVPNRQHLYPLLQSGGVASQWFICPSGNDVPMADDQIKSHHGFLEARNISYAAQNMAGVRPAFGESPRLIVLGDDNPVFDDGLPTFDLAMRRIGLSDPMQSNSRAHRGAGQNILQGDGVVRWATSPNCGVDGDNIWSLSNIDHYTGHEGPTTASDSHLLK